MSEAEEIVESTLANIEDTNARGTMTPPAVVDAAPAVWVTEFLASNTPHPATWNESFMWRIYYTDGEVWPELDALGNDRGFATVDMTRVKAIEIIPTRAGLNSAVVNIDLASGMRPIFFRRRFIMTTPDGIETGRANATCLGWQRTIEVGDEKRNIASYTFFLEDGSVLITENPNII